MMGKMEGQQFDVVGDGEIVCANSEDGSYGDLETLIGENEGGVGGCQLSGRHFVRCVG